jgi:hypothetical protein
MQTKQTPAPVLDLILMQKIKEIDLSNVFARLVKKEMPEKDVVKAIDDYRKFLYIVIMYEGKHRPTAMVDMVWHDHILHTLQYMRDCEQIAGRYIHHFPDPVAYGDCDACSGTTNCQEKESIPDRPFVGDYRDVVDLLFA